MSTIRDVAKHVGVSVATVSRVINQSDSVSNLTKKKVNEAITELHYSPFYAAQTSKQTNVLVIIPNSITDLQGRMIDGLQTAAMNLSIQLFIGLCHKNEDIQEQYINELRKRSVQAIVFLGTNKKAEELNLLSRDYPICICGDYIEGINFLSVTSDVFQSSYNAVTHLIKKGFDRIGMISSLTRVWSSLQKEAAYQKALEDNGIPYRPEYIFYNHFSMSGNYAFRYFESLDEPPNAIFSISDFIASSIINPIQRKYELGKDYSLIGFDNTIYSQLTGITTIGQDLELMGQIALEKLNSQLQNPKKAKNEKLTIPSELILRQSTGDI